MIIPLLGRALQVGDIIKGGPSTDWSYGEITDLDSEPIYGHGEMKTVELHGHVRSLKTNHVFRFVLLKNGRCYCDTFEVYLVTEVEASRRE